MTLWHPDTCACRVRLDDDGEPAGYEARCALHQRAPVSAVIARCRAKNLAVAQVRARPGGSDADEPLVEFDDQGVATATHVDFFAGRMTRKTSGPLTRDEFIAGINALKGG